MFSPLARRVKLCRSALTLTHCHAAVYTRACFFILFYFILINGGRAADEATTRQWVAAAIAAAGDAPNAGKIMGALMKEYKGVLDGKLAQKIVKEVLG